MASQRKNRNEGSEYRAGASAALSAVFDELRSPQLDDHEAIAHFAAALLRVSVSKRRGLEAATKDAAADLLESMIAMSYVHESEL